MPPVEKHRFSRILCGYFNFGTSKAHKYRLFPRLDLDEPSSEAGSASFPRPWHAANNRLRVG